MNDFFIDEDGVVKSRAEEAERKANLEKEALFKEKEKVALTEEEIIEEEKRIKEEEALKKVLEEEAKRKEEEARLQKELAEIKAQNRKNSDSNDPDQIKIKVFLLIVIFGLLIYFISSSFKGRSERKKAKLDTNANLKTVVMNFTDLKFDKTDYDYDVVSEVPDVRPFCLADSKKAKVTGCETIKLKLNETKTIKVRVESEFGNKKTYVFNVTYKKPITVFIDDILNLPDRYIAKNVEIAVKASGELADVPYSFDGGETWTKKNKYTATDKVTLNIAVRGKNGDIAKRSVIVKIDKTVPKVKLINSQNRIVQANVSPASPKSAYSYKWYVNGELRKDLNGSTVRAVDKGTYKVVVTTSSGLSGEGSTLVYWYKKK